MGLLSLSDLSHEYRLTLNGTFPSSSYPGTVYTLATFIEGDMLYCLYGGSLKRLGLVFTFNLTSWTLGPYASIDPGSNYMLAEGPLLPL